MPKTKKEGSRNQWFDLFSWWRHSKCSSGLEQDLVPPYDCKDQNDFSCEYQEEIATAYQPQKHKRCIPTPGHCLGKSEVCHPAAPTKPLCFLRSECWISSASQPEISLPCFMSFHLPGQKKSACSPQASYQTNAQLYIWKGGGEH